MQLFFERTADLIRLRDAITAAIGESDGTA